MAVCVCVCVHVCVCVRERERERGRERERELGSCVKVEVAIPVPNKPDGFCGCVSCETTPRSETVKLKADCADGTWQVTAKCAYS